MALKSIWTIGYERVGPGDFVAALEAAKIKTLIDVRDVANSRRAGFSKRALMASLSEAGIAYVHLKALGTPKAGREAARKGDVKTMHRIFEAKLAEPGSQLACLMTILSFTARMGCRRRVASSPAAGGDGSGNCWP
jgi:Protein of unknown function, DUF488